MKPHQHGNHRINDPLIRLIKVAIRLLLFLLSVFLFILALIMMKEGARPLAPFIRNEFSVNSPASALGFGWLTASLALSGSPVAATSLAFLDADVLSPMEAFAMISGSRLGAAFLVLIVGFIYVLRGKQRNLSMSVGLLSLLVTQTIYPVVLFFGYITLANGWLKTIAVNTSNKVNGPIEILFSPVMNLLEKSLPSWTLLLSGFLCMVFSLWFFDHILPDLHLEKTNLRMFYNLRYRPVVTFIMGAVLTALTMSVSVSLGLLVPISVRGLVRRENIIPYILGANITTLLDTLLAATLLGNPVAVQVVLLQMLGVALVSMVILVLLLRVYERFMEILVEFISRRRRNMFVYVLVIFVVPLLLLIYG